MTRWKGTDETVYKSKKDGFIQESKKILRNYSEKITLRQLYYRLVSKNLIENKISQYQYLSVAMRDARVEGIISWDEIEDRTREFHGGDVPRISPESRVEWKLDQLKETKNQHELPMWMGQDNYVEVWFEKEALSSLFGGVCNEFNVVHYPCRGYSSVTKLHEAAKRVKNKDAEKKKIILYFGDYDPSGMDIERDITTKLRKTFDIDLSVERIALNRELIDEYRLPPQPAKETDARYDDFVKAHGDEVVELDALEPEILKKLIRKSIGRYFDRRYWTKEVLPKQKEEKEQIQKYVDKILKNVPENVLGGV